MGNQSPAPRKRGCMTGATVDRSGVGRLDHGVLNVPLAKRGDINAQLDRYKADEAKNADAAHRARFHDVRTKKARIAALLASLTDDRALALAKPLGATLPRTARAALAREASRHVDLWLDVLWRDAGQDMAARCATCRLRGCDCPAEDWLGAAPDEDAAHPTKQENERGS